MTSPADVARAYLRSFDTRDPASIAALVTDDFDNQQTSALGASSTGRTEYRDRLAGFLAAFDGLHYDPIELVAGAGDVVAIRYRMTARYDGHAVDIPGVMMIEIRGDLIARRTDFWDSMTFLAQTGDGPADHDPTHRTGGDAHAG
ncbi:MAG: nuclear transport factor 2 family protein [Ilumatobacteraceae bacterium]